METITLNKKWQPLFTSDDTYYLLTGGRGSGKSFAISYFALGLISVESGHRVAVYRATMVSVKNSIMQTMKDLAAQLPNIDEFEIKEREIVNKVTGSSIFFKGIQTARLDYTAALKGLEGCTTFILDEAEELTDIDLWDKINDSFRLLNKQIRMIISLNPTTREHWIYQHFILQNGWNEGECGSKDDITYIHSSYLDNLSNLAPKKIRAWEKAKTTRPDYYKHVIEGGWRARAQGAIFTNWSVMSPDWEWEERGIIDTTDTNQATRFKWMGNVGYGQDYGFSPDVSTLIKVGIDKRLGKIYLHECFYESSLSTQQIINMNMQFAGKDGLIVGDNSEMRLINDIARYCNIIPCTKGPDSIVSGIKIMQDYELVVTPSSVNLMRELNNYSWDKKKIDKHLETPDDKWNHAIDGVRYYVMHELLDGYSEDLDFM